MDWTRLTYRFNILQGNQLGAQPSMYAQELFVHHSRQRQGAERIHTSVIDIKTVFVLALALEGEVIGKMAAFVITSEKPESIRIPDLQRP